jgi:hypothetical protein
MAILADQSVVAAAEYFLEKSGDHAETRWAAQKRKNFSMPPPAERRLQMQVGLQVDSNGPESL